MVVLKDTLKSVSFLKCAKTYLIVSWSEMDSIKNMFAKFLSNEDLANRAHANSFENQELRISNCLHFWMMRVGFDHLSVTIIVARERSCEANP